MDPRMMPKGQDAEYNWNERDGRSPNTPGVYFHPQANKFVETAFATDQNGNPILREGERVYDKINGKIQADAFVQIGYRKASTEEIKRFRSEQEKMAKTVKAVMSGKNTVV